MNTYPPLVLDHPRPTVSCGEPDCQLEVIAGEPLGVIREEIPIPIDCVIDDNTREELANGVTRVRARVSPNAIKLAAHNPAARTAEKSVSSLIRTIQKDGGILSDVHLTMSDLSVIDGHRRTVAARYLKYPYVWAWLYSGPPEALRQLYADANIATRAFGKNDQLISALCDGPVFSDTIKKTKEFLEDTLSEEELERFVDRNFGGHLVSVAKRIAKFCGFKSAGAEYRPFVRKTIVWLMERKQQQNAIAYMREGKLKGSLAHPKHLRVCVEKDRKIFGDEG